MRLRRVDCSGPGITRRRAGRGFAYYDEDGERVTEPEVLERIRELVLPPAWRDVWICPYPDGHLQATGIDAAGRKQYRYHEAWRTRRDAEKFEDMVRFAKALPALRERVEADQMVFDYPAKSGQRRLQAVVDPLVLDIVGQLKRRRGGGPELLAFKVG